MTDQIVPQKKYCNACKIERPVSEFYTRGKHSKHYTSECKECMKSRSKRQPKRNRQESTVESETRTIAKLLENGIPALPGKALGHQFADICIWGCILAEVKYSTLIDNQFSFAFTSAQQHQRVRGEFIILVADWGDHTDYYVFPVKHPAFYNARGKIKTAFAWTPNRSHVGRPGAISEGERESYRDAWHLIETRRIEIVQQLREKKIIALPIAA